MKHNNGFPTANAHHLWKSAVTTQKHLTSLLDILDYTDDTPEDTCRHTAWRKGLVGLKVHLRNEYTFVNALCARGLYNNDAELVATCDLRAMHRALMAHNGQPPQDGFTTSWVQGQGALLDSAVSMTTKVCATLDSCR